MLLLCLGVGVCVVILYVCVSMGVFGSCETSL